MFDLKIFNIAIFMAATLSDQHHEIHVHYMNMPHSTTNVYENERKINVTFPYLVLYIRCMYLIQYHMTNVYLYPVQEIKHN